MDYLKYFKEVIAKLQCLYRDATVMISNPLYCINVQVNRLLQYYSYSAYIGLRRSISHYRTLLQYYRYSGYIERCYSIALSVDIQELVERQRSIHCYRESIALPHSIAILKAISHCYRNYIAIVQRILQYWMDIEALRGILQATGIISQY